MATGTEPLFSQGRRAQPKLRGNFNCLGVVKVSLLCLRDAINIFAHDTGKEYWEGVLFCLFLPAYHVLNEVTRKESGCTQPRRVHQAIAGTRRLRSPHSLLRFDPLRGSGLEIGPRTTAES